MDNIKKDNYTYLKIRSSEIDKIKKELKLRVVKDDKDEITFMNNLKANDLLSKLSKYKIDNLLIEEIPLEDLFINYYK